MKELVGLVDEDLYFYDMRREVLFYLVKKVDVMMFVKILGYRDIKILLNIYYVLDMSDVVGLLD